MIYQHIKEKGIQLKRYFPKRNVIKKAKMNQNQRKGASLLSNKKKIRRKNEDKIAE